MAGETAEHSTAVAAAAAALWRELSGKAPSSPYGQQQGNADVLLLQQQQQQQQAGLAAAGLLPLPELGDRAAGHPVEWWSSYGADALQASSGAEQTLLPAVCRPMFPALGSQQGQELLLQQLHQQQQQQQQQQAAMTMLSSSVEQDSSMLDTLVRQLSGSVVTTEVGEVL
jgi:hypothetical protein